MFSWDRESRDALLGGTSWAASGAIELLTIDAGDGDEGRVLDGRRYCIALLNRLRISVGVGGGGKGSWYRESV